AAYPSTTDAGCGRRVDEGVEGVEQPEVANVVQGAAEGRPALLQVMVEVFGYGGVDRTDGRLPWFCGQRAVQPGGHHLTVADPAQLVGQPGQLPAQRLGPSPVPDAVPERAQGAAQPPGRHPHGVHGRGIALAHGRIVADDGVTLVADVGEYR